MREIMMGDTTLKTKVEHGLRDSREMVEAMEVILAEEAADARSMEKMEKEDGNKAI